MVVMAVMAVLLQASMHPSYLPSSLHAKASKYLEQLYET